MVRRVPKQDSQMGIQCHEKHTHAHRARAGTLTTR